jgi:hypothetical protein
MATIKLELEVEEVNGVLAVLGELPSKTGAWNLITKIQQQATPQLPAEENKEQPAETAEAKPAT